MNPLTIHLAAYLFAGSIGFSICYFAAIAGRAKMRRDFGRRLIVMNNEHVKAVIKAKSESFKLGMQAATNHFQRMHICAEDCLCKMRDLKEQGAVRDLKAVLEHN